MGKRAGRPDIVAIDGPAASGKSTVGSKLARRWGYLYFDTGLMYRAVTWYVLEEGISPEDEKRVTSAAEEIRIDVQPPSRDDGRDYDVLVDGEDITWEIRTPRVDSNVSVVAAYPGVRQALTGQQRRIGMRGEVVMVGRDIGTVVLPEADLKIYLDASVVERALRRYRQRRDRGEEIELDQITRVMKMRDEIDSSREVAPLRAAEDAVIINSDELTVEQVLDRIESIVDEVE
ncbi:MAG: (d)CMP kinase [Anaerolineales bacterium]|nr:(d)CMP kinase [Anaerolineales bacterium]